ncbi:MAG TPA: hypothetical protein VJ650_16800 [Gemmatimonadaceae bacterium]|nr:hypothetical protein [Gemmatimonadaceae bacterium]
MTARQRVRRTRALLLATIVLRALVWGAAAGVAAIAAAGLLDLLVDLPRALRGVVVPLAIVLAIAVVLAHLWRGRRARSLPATALWIEERVPSLRYALVTSLEQDDARASSLLEREVERHRWESTVLPRALSRAFIPPLIAVGLATAMIVLLPRGVVARVRAPRAGDAVDRPPIARPPAASRLTPIAVRVVPPAYTGLSAARFDEPHTIEALVGSRLELEGRGTSEGIVATVGDTRFTATGRGSRWQLALTMPAMPSPLILRDREFDRLIVLDARPDSSPVVAIVAPTRDTILRTPTGRIPIRGEARDALGLASTWLEYIVSSGQGESFRFRSGVLARRSHNGARQATLETTVVIDSLRLAPGDVVHLRLVARDRNPARDAGTGASETRVVRIARVGEYDSVAVEGAPPPEADTSAISQRMLILLTEALVRREPRLSRDTLVRESRAIGDDQSRLRRRVGEIIFSRLTGEEGAEHSHEEEERRGQMTAEELLRAAEEATEHGAGEVLDFAEGESPVVAINRPLLEAYNAMWSAATELNVGAPRRALPHMYAALAAIERARQAERVYLRGRPAAVVVDVNRARLSGKRDSLPPTSRSPRAYPSSAIPAHRFARAAELMIDDRQAAIDSLMLLRIEVLDRSPSGAAALGDVIAALREGRTVAPALARARNILAGPPRSDNGLQPWGVAW